MEITKELNEAITDYLRISIKTKDKWTSELETSSLRVLNLLTSNIDESIRFIEEECNADRYGFLSSLLPELIKRTNDVRFINCFRSLEAKYTNEFYCYFVDYAIEEAEKYLR